MAPGIPHSGGLARGNDKVFGSVLLQHEPHAFHIVTGVSPVALGIQVAQVQAFLLRPNGRLSRIPPR